MSASSNFFACYGVVVLAAWSMPEIPDTLAPLHVPMNPARGVPLQPLSRIVLGRFRDSLGPVGRCNASTPCTLHFALGKDVAGSEIGRPIAEAHFAHTERLFGESSRTPFNARTFPDHADRADSLDQTRIEIDETAWYQTSPCPVE